jgi:alpha-tubulin suppressor-like RCC1 family protein
MKAAAAAAAACLLVGLVGCLKVDARDGFPCSASGRCPAPYTCAVVQGTQGCFRSPGSGGGTGGGDGGPIDAGDAGDAGAVTDAHDGGAPCVSPRHICGGQCVDNTADQCGSSCIKCTAPQGATAICATSGCDFDCGSLKKCAASMICVATDGCCDDSDCPQLATGQTGTCDTGMMHTCNYSCPSATTRACTKAGTTTCLTAGQCCVDSDCSGTCQTCSASHQCMPALGVADPNGRCAGTCDTTGICKAKQGQLCTTVLAGCVDPTTCVDNYCCNTACTGTCMACDVATFEGTCTNVPTGMAPHGTRTCGGCNGTNFVGPGTCGSGTCASTPAPQPCPGGFICSGATCKTSCAFDSDCLGNYFCSPSETTCHLDAVKIAAGQTHTCVLLVDGTVRCWGQGGIGQLGNGTLGGMIGPVAAQGLTGAIGIACGGNHCCAWKNDGTLLCWGSNFYGELGSAPVMNANGQPGASAPTPVTAFPPAGTTVSSVATGYTHTCALLSDHSVWCWGGDVNGGLGMQPTTSVNGNAFATVTPLHVTGISGQPSALAAADGATYALLSSGGLVDWGSNFMGDLGNGGTTYSEAPMVSGVTGLTAVAGATSNDFACALAAGGVKCWGDDYFGQLGNNMFGMSFPSPVNVPNPAGAGATATAITVGDNHACAAYSNASVWCWGSNLNLQLGAMTTTTVGGGLDPGSATPVRAGGLTTQVTALAGASAHTCALLANGSAVCWGSNNGATLGIAPNTTAMSATAVQVLGW